MQTRLNSKHPSVSQIARNLYYSKWHDIILKGHQSKKEDKLIVIASVDVVNTKKLFLIASKFLETVVILWKIFASRSNFIEIENLNVASGGDDVSVSAMHVVGADFSATLNLASHRPT